MKYTKMIVSALCALFIATSAFAATNSVANQVYKSEASPVWDFTLGGVGATAGDNIGVDWIWGGQIGIARIIPIDLWMKEPLKTEVGVRQSFSYGTVGYNKYTRTDTTYGSYQTIQYVDAPCTVGPVPVTVDNPYAINQTVTGVEKKDGWVFGTQVFWDVDVTIYKSLVLFFGPFAEVDYGNITATWYVGPEAGLKLNLGKGFYTFAKADYGWNLSGSQDRFGTVFGLGKVF